MKKHIVHRWSKRLLIVVITIAVLIIALYFLLEYETLGVVKYAVDKQSNGAYQLDADRLNLSFIDHTLILKNASIRQKNTQTGKTSLKVDIPSLYLRVDSWRTILFQKKFLIDSLIIHSPSLEKWEETTSGGDKMTFETSNIFNDLQKTADQLNIRYFNLMDGSFTLHPADSSAPLSVNHIRFSISNFNRGNDSTKRFLSADDVELFIPEQDLKMDNGNRELKFKRLYFSAKDQKFELDSCYILSYNPVDESGTALSADHFSLRSDSLFAFYENNALVLDTLECTHPVLQMRTVGKTNTLDTAQVIHQSIKNLLTTDVRIRHLIIDDGQFAIENVKGNKSSNYTTQRTDLAVTDLSVSPTDSPFFRIGKIDLSLQKLIFYTPDSLYELSVEEFNWLNDNVQFRKAWFGPTPKNRAPSSFQAIIPSLDLNNISFEDLIRSKLTAQIANMDSPVIIIHAVPSNIDTVPKKGLPEFYEALHALSELMHVNILNIRTGMLAYDAPQNGNLKVNVNDFNSAILLNDFLQSASLIDIKHSIPYMEIVQINASSKTMKAKINELTVLGSIQNNTIQRLDLNLVTGLKLTAQNIFWHELNWDSLKSTGHIVDDSLHAKKLSISMTQSSAQKKSASKKLPPIRINGLKVDALSFNYAMASNKRASLQGKNILLTNLTTSGNEFYWSNAQGNFSKISYQSPDIKAAINAIQLNLKNLTTIQDIRADVNDEAGTIHVAVPNLILQGTINSTNFSNLDLTSLQITNPQVKVSEKLADTVPPKPLKIPINASVGNLNIENGFIAFRLQRGTDTLHFSSTLGLVVSSLSTHKDSSKVIDFKNADVSFSDFSFGNRRLKTSSASTTMSFADGAIFNDNGKRAIQTMVSGNWKDAGLLVNFKKGAQLEVQKFSGALIPTAFDSRPGKKIVPVDWLQQSSISQGEIFFNDSLKKIYCHDISWNPSRNLLKVDSLAFIRKDSVRAYFANSKWQSDFIFFHGSAVALSGIDWDKWKKDTIFSAKKLSFQNFTVDVSRDKRVPFQHGIEKLMPTKLIQSVRRPFSIDSVIVYNSTINYHEFSAITNREGTVPLFHLNAIVKNVRNIHPQHDTMIILGRVQLLNANIRKFRYQEAYGDSLASFTMGVKAAPTELPDLSKITNPLAAIDIQSGKCDTMVMRVSGNKYASLGEMNFYYRDLKVNLLDKQDTLKKKFSLAFINFVANKFVIHPKNTKPSNIFFIRDQEKFVFNYWIKTMMSGVLTSVGVKSNKKYKKQYKQMKKQYRLPDYNF